MHLHSGRLQGPLAQYSVPAAIIWLAASAVGEAKVVCNMDALPLAWRRLPAWFPLILKWNVMPASFPAPAFALTAPDRRVKAEMGRSAGRYQQFYGDSTRIENLRPETRMVPARLRGRN
jgi:hypothetical protein